MNTKFCTVATALLLSSTSAIACDGFYMGLRGGVVNHNFGESTASGDTYEIDDNAMFGAGSLGYRYGYFRAELEYIWREETDSESGDTVGLGADKTTFQTQSYMLNGFVDLSPYTRFTPFIMAGIGMTNVTLEHQPFGGAKENFDEDNFTWSVGAGISAKITNRFNMDIGYRFFDMGEIEEATIKAHEVYGGIRYVF